MTIPSKFNVAVDLTPLRPGGENGGAKTLVSTLLRLFADLRSQEFHYLLIAEPWNYDEIIRLSGPNMTCVLRSELYSPRETHSTVDGSGLASVEGSALVPPPAGHSLGVALKKTLKKTIKDAAHVTVGLLRPVYNPKSARLLKLKAAIKGSRWFDWAQAKLLSLPDPNLLLSSGQSPGLLQQHYGADLLFCPFSAPHLAEPGLPVVAIAYDLQHLDLPFFFTPGECAHRTRFLSHLVSCANTVICISDFTRQSFIRHLGADLDQLVVVPLCIHERLTPLDHDDVHTILAGLGLAAGQYLFFPANFWPHKNHRMLLAAYSIYRQQHPDTALDLVFTGALEGPQVELREIVRHLGYEAHVHFLGFLQEKELIALWQGCRGLVFPSLYEGFGIPVLEALWFDKPVACSAIGSLPEVGGDAVIYFDPRQPEAIAAAMGTLAHDEQQIVELRGRFQQHLTRFSQRAMAEQYLDVFENVVAATPEINPQLSSVV
jgi:glycosyltransferase involved in cell wall biosynthesis